MWDMQVAVLGTLRQDSQSGAGRGGLSGYHWLARSLQFIIAMASAQPKSFRRLSMFGRNRSGQSTVEYMMLVSVIVIAIVAAAYVFIPTFQGGVQALATDVSSTLGTGNIRDIGRGP